MAPVILCVYCRLTEEDRSDLEKQVKTLQEGYNLLFSESLKQQELQPSGEAKVKVEEKVTLLTRCCEVWHDWEHMVTHSPWGLYAESMWMEF